MSRTFRLTRIYSLISLIGIAVIAGVLSFFYRAYAVNALKEHEKEANITLTRLLANTIWPRISQIASSTGSIDSLPGPKPSSGQGTQNLIADLGELRRDLPIVNVRIYSPESIIIFSTDSKEIGQREAFNTGLQRARVGIAVSEITFRHEYSDFERKVLNRNLVSSYVPIRDETTGRFLATFAIDSDVTALVKEIDHTSYAVVGGSTLLMFGLYLFLLAFIRRADRRIQQLEQEEYDAQQERLRYLAHHDGLTNLPNRALFMNLLDRALQRAAQSKKLLAVMIIGLDRFKLINDSLGHDAGDRVLVDAAQRLSTCSSSGETVCRIGGDQFAVILENLSSPDCAGRMAEKIINCFDYAMHVDGRDIIISSSVGVAFYPTDSTDGERLVKDSEAAMYRAKELGRNRCEFYTEELNARALERLETEIALRNALQKGEFVLYYQPKLSTRTGKVVGMEALLRWRRPLDGIVSPVGFISLLEDSGLVIPVGEWAIREACRQTKEWQERGYGDLRLSVNLSVKQFRSDSLLPSVQKALETSGLDPRSLQLELTESVLAEDTPQAIELLQRLKALGISLSIDDFGTGYSSLSYLMHFPIDALKIDRSFVRDMATNEEHSALTSTIVAMARNLNLGIVAEGVENAQQLELLCATGCDEVQGFLFSEPVAADEFLDVVKRINARFAIGQKEAGNDVTCGQLFALASE